MATPPAVPTASAVPTEPALPTASAVAPTRSAASGGVRAGFVRSLARVLATATPDGLRRPVARADGTPLAWFVAAADHVLAGAGHQAPSPGSPVGGAAREILAAAEQERAYTIHMYSSDRACACPAAACGARLTHRPDRCPVHGPGGYEPAEFGHGAARCPALAPLRAAT